MSPLKVIWCIFCLVRRLIHHRGPKGKLHLLFHPFLSHPSYTPSLRRRSSNAALSNLRRSGNATFWQELQDSFCSQLNAAAHKDGTELNMCTQSFTRSEGWCMTARKGCSILNIVNKFCGEDRAKEKWRRKWSRHMRLNNGGGETAQTRRQTLQIYFFNSVRQIRLFNCVVPNQEFECPSWSFHLEFLTEF